LQEEEEQAAQEEEDKVDASKLLLSTSEHEVKGVGRVGALQ